MEEQQQLTEVQSDNSPEDFWHVCGQCDRRFSNERGLTMHKIRSHSDKNWDTGNNFRGKKGAPSMDPRLVHRREYQKKLRERYKREGRNSRGELMPQGWKPQKRSYSKTLTGEAREAYLAKQRKYQRNHYHKVMAAKKAAAAVVEQPVLTENKLDITGEAARAILAAAAVIRAVSTGMKISQ